ncbi:MAG: M15 family metallopeptidase [Vallitaleaceae bacterium]|nr:M15 family metallopeptidase [Vallitaleaceae bacterium]
MKNFKKNRIQYFLLLSILIFTTSCSTISTEIEKTPTLSESIHATVEDGIALEESTNEALPTSAEPDTDGTSQTVDVSSEADSSDILSPTHEEAPEMEYEETDFDITSYHKDLSDIQTKTDLHLPDFSDTRLNGLLSHFNESNYNSERFQIATVSTPDSLYVLSNKLNKLSEDYVPQNLMKPEVTFSISGDDQKMYLQKEAADALTLLFEDALANDLQLVAVSGYRSYARQKSIYENNVATRGQEETDKISARPGHSEHQTGLAMDISCSSLGNKLEFSFAETPEGIWVKENAYRFGFIIRYGQSQENITGYAYEPWHLRYVGLDLASYLYEYQITLEELYFTVLSSR